MSSDAYELISLTARYVFAALMLLIVLRAARLTAADSGKAAKLRRLSPMTGVCGELVVLEGDGNARRGMRYPVIREGMIGSSGRADVRIRHKSVRRRHAYFQMTKQGLKLRDHANARLRNADGGLVRELTLADGGEFMVGGVRLLLVLSDASAVQPAQREDDLFAAGLRQYDELDGPSGRPARYDGLDETGAVRRPARYDGLDESGAVRRPARYDELDGFERTAGGIGAAEARHEGSARRALQADELDARRERREEFRQAMRPGDVLERRGGYSAEYPRRGGLDSGISRRPAGISDGISGTMRRPANIDDGISGTMRRSAEATRGVDFDDGIAGMATDSGVRTRRSTAIDDGVSAPARRSTAIDDGAFTHPRRSAEAMRGAEDGISRQPRRSAAVRDGIVSTSGRPAPEPSVRPRQSRSGEVRRREILPPEDLFLNDDASVMDDEDW